MLTTRVPQMDKFSPRFNFAGNKFLIVFYVNLIRGIKSLKVCFLANFSLLNKNLYRSSRSQMFFEIGVLKNVAIFTGKHLCWSLFLMKLQAFKAYNFIKKRLQHTCFPVNIGKYLRSASL